MINIYLHTDKKCSKFLWAIPVIFTGIFYRLTKGKTTITLNDMFQFYDAAVEIYKTSGKFPDVVGGVTEFEFFLELDELASVLSIITINKKYKIYITYGEA